MPKVINKRRHSLLKTRVCTCLALDSARDRGALALFGEGKGGARAVLVAAAGKLEASWPGDALGRAMQNGIRYAIFLCTTTLVGSSPPAHFAGVPRRPGVTMETVWNARAAARIAAAAAPRGGCSAPHPPVADCGAPTRQRERERERGIHSAAPPPPPPPSATLACKTQRGPTDGIYDQHNYVFRWNEQSDGRNVCSFQLPLPPRLHEASLSFAYTHSRTQNTISLLIRLEF